MSDKVSYEIQFKIPFHDLDPLHIVWHGNYLKYFDIARFGLFKKCRIDLYHYSIKNNIYFPVTKTSTKHILPLTYGDEVVCKAELREVYIKIVLDFELFRPSDNTICTRGQGEQVAIKLPERETLFEIPVEIRKALDPSL